jgi:hypothetical protein
LFNLIKGPFFIVLYTLAKNKIEIDFNVFINTRANRFAFINLTLTDQLYKGLGLQLTLLFYIIQAKGYNK